MFTNLILNFLSVDTISQVIAKIIANLLRKASTNGGEMWDKVKAVIVQINTWTSIFIQVYEDDNLTKEEEEQIAKAIKEKTQISKISDILKK